jgi:peptide-methionine (S)-S-oxide reductase
MTEIAVFGGGCFWCTEPVFAALRGVVRVEPGYAGGHVEHPTYEQVCQQDTGHIEVVRVEFDPELISYESLLQVFFATHDPTTLDQQGADVGPQYASVIFCQTPAQRETAERVLNEVQSAMDQRIVTRVRDADTFWPAEPVHRNYYARNPEQGYCRVVISPKLQKFRRHFSELLAT